MVEFGARPRTTAPFDTRDALRRALCRPPRRLHPALCYARPRNSYHLGTRTLRPGDAATAARPQGRSSHPFDRSISGKHVDQDVLATNKRRPHSLGLPNLFHIGARLGLVRAEHVATIAIEKS